jgi:ArsR family transcriptional regulator, virulence genes transcriptional regulator
MGGIYAKMQIQDNSTTPNASSTAAPSRGAAPSPDTTSSSDARAFFAMHAELCKALASEHRLAIMYSLRDGERCVGDIAADLDISVHNVSQHLRILKQRQLVRSRKEGQTVYYCITNPKFIQACTLIRQALLEQHLEEGQSLQAAELLDSADTGGLGVRSQQTGIPN